VDLKWRICEKFKLCISLCNTSVYSCIDFYRLGLYFDRTINFGSFCRNILHDTIRSFMTSCHLTPACNPMVISWPIRWPLSDLLIKYIDCWCLACIQLSNWRVLTCLYMGCVGSGQLFGGFGWAGSRKIDPWTTLLSPIISLYYFIFVFIV